MIQNPRKQPFLQSRAAEKLAPGLLSPDEFRNALANLEQSELPGFLRAYIEEGTPAAFYKAPLIWEAVRDWLSQRLSVNPKSFGLVGSARTGFSCEPTKYGSLFTCNSDLDLCAIDNKLFSLAARDGRKFCACVDSAQLMGRSDREKEFWPENSRVISRNLPAGFIDADKIPSMHDQFAVTAKVNNEMSILVNRLQLTPGYSVRYASLRIYESWECFAKRVLFNLQVLKKKI